MRLKKFPQNAIFLGGTHSKDQIKRVLRLFDSHKQLTETLFQSYLVKKGKKKFLLAFNIYGSVITAEAVSCVHDKSVKNIIFIGTCGANAEVPIGSYVLPNKVRCYDGLTNLLSPKIKYVYPNKELFRKTKRILDKESPRIETTISVPTFFYTDKRIERIAKKYFAVEIELSSLFYFSKKLNIKSTGILVVSDTPKTFKKMHREDLFEKREKRILHAIRLVVRET